MASLEAIGLADRILKGVLVSGFQNDADIEKTLMSQLDLVAGSIDKAIPEIIEIRNHRWAEEEAGKTKIPYLSPNDPLRISYPVEGFPLDRLETATKAFFESLGEVNGMGAVKGVVFTQEDRCEVSFADYQIRITIDGANFPPMTEAKAEKKAFVPHGNLPGCEKGSLDYRPMPETVWRHHASRALYVVRGISNRDGTKAKYPTMVEYRGRHDGEPYSGRLDDWHRRMSFVGFEEQIESAIIPEVDSPRWIEMSDLNGEHYGVFIRDDQRYVVIGRPSSDGEVAACRVEPLDKHRRKPMKASPNERWNECRDNPKLATPYAAAMPIPADGPVRECFRAIVDYLESPGSASRHKTRNKLMLLLGDL